VYFDLHVEPMQLDASQIMWYCSVFLAPSVSRVSHWASHQSLYIGCHHDNNHGLWNFWFALLVLLASYAPIRLHAVWWYIQQFHTINNCNSLHFVTANIMPIAYI